MYRLTDRTALRSLALCTFSLIACTLLAVCVNAFSTQVALAAEDGIRIDDRAELLTEAEHDKLRQDYASLSAYLDAGFVTTSEKGYSSAESFASAYMRQNFSSSPAVIFLIDMNHREIYIYANQAGLATVSQADGRAITDNIYTYASKGAYYDCADAAFAQILTKCEGGHIARPVKHITNALIAVVAGILVGFFFMVYSRVTRRDKSVDDSARTPTRIPQFSFAEPVVAKVERRYKDNDGGGGGGGGGGGHGF